jgi:serine/threonine protein kinase
MAQPRRGGIGTLQRYEGLTKIGEGTYGYVYQGKDKFTGDTVALKKLLIYKESSGFPLCAIREIKCLNSLKHSNIVNLREIVTSKGCEQLESGLAGGRGDGREGSSAHPHAASAASGEANASLAQCGSLYLVFDYIEHDLAGLIDTKYKFNIGEIQSLMKQLFEALDFLHSRNIMHRDVKPSNLLVSQRLKLQLADFGLARSTDTLLQNVPVLGASGGQSADSEDWCCDYDYHSHSHGQAQGQLARAGAGAGRVDGAAVGKSVPRLAPLGAKPSHAATRRPPPLPMEYTNNVITLWYRPPELLLGGLNYGCSVDIWSAGCVFAELLILKPLFPGKAEPEQFELICKLIGLPTESTWVGMSALPGAGTMLAAAAAAAGVHHSNIRTACAGVIPSVFLDLLERLLVADPGKRSSARLALGNRFFLQNLGKPGESAGALRIDPTASFHEYQTKKRKHDALRENANSANSNTSATARSSNSSSSNSSGSGRADAMDISR